MYVISNAFSSGLKADNSLCQYIIFNLGMAPSFQAQDFKNLKFPSTMYIDWVRVYQKTGVNNIGCDPSNYPTTDYINKWFFSYSYWMKLFWWKISSLDTWTPIQTLTWRPGLRPIIPSLATLCTTVAKRTLHSSNSRHCPHPPPGKSFALPSSSILHLSALSYIVASSASAYACIIALDFFFTLRTTSRWPDLYYGLTDLSLSLPFAHFPPYTVGVGLRAVYFTSY